MVTNPFEAPGLGWEAEKCPSRCVSSQDGGFSAEPLVIHLLDPCCQGSEPVLALQIFETNES